MSLTLRRVIYIIFIIIFIVTAPLLVGYTVGYRYNFKRGKIQKVGVLVIETVPQGAQVILDGVPLKKKAPIRVNNLLPNDYEVIVEKDGFYSWKKHLGVSSGLATFAENLVLFKKNIPLKLLDGEIQQIVLPRAEIFSPQKLVYLALKEEGEEIWSLDLNTHTKELFYRTPQDPRHQLKIIEQSQQPKILVAKYEQDKIDFLILNPANSEKIVSLRNLTKLDFESVKWQADNLLYGLAKNNLYQINLSNKNIRKLAQNIKNDYLIKDETLFFIENDQNLSSLKKTRLESQRETLNQNSEKIIDLPFSQNYIFLEGPKPILTLQNLENQNLLVIDPEFQNILLDTKAQRASWGENKLLYTTDFELWTYDLASEKKELITRYSQPIGQSLWEKNHQHIIHLLEGSLQIIELDHRDIRNVIDLVSFDKIINFVLTQDGAKLYFIGEVESQKGLYELEIH